jgi:hypothetical protein
MQRHRHHHIAVFKRSAASPAQPAGEAGHQLEAVGMLERQDHPAAMIVIGQDGAGGIESRWFCQARGAEIFALQRHRERQPATGAAGAVEKGDAAPAGGAKARLADGRAAVDAQRRKQQIQNRFGDSRGHGLL